ncbi:MAG: UDP-3-O-acylglucosamine N-acyltransferase [Phycisphaerae bacterium]|nr:UDP-3-O-acylglucosamine N-acyltransferase [Phycisphaerae bacterium]
MPHTLSQVCEILERYAMQPTLAGDGRRSIAGVATLEEASEEQISFLSNPKYEKMLAGTRAAAVVCKPEIAAPPHLNVVRVADPYAAITVLIAELHGYRRHPRPRIVGGAAHVAPSAVVGENANIHPGATIDEHATVGRNATVYPGVYVGPRCRIGDDVTLYPNVVLYDDTVLGNRVTIHAGTVIGNDGLGYAPIGGKWVKIPQIGIVELGDDVEIGANCSIDRATLGRTRIGNGTKMSNLIAIGHGTHVGEHCMFVAQVGLAGSVEVGDRVTMAGQAGVVGHIRIGDKATIGAKAGVTNSVADGETVLGAPAIPVREMRRQVACLMRLPETTETVKQLDKRLAELERRLGEAT